MSSGPLRYEREQVLRGHTGGVLAVSFSGDGKFIATAGSDCLVCIWRVDGGLLLHTATFQEPVLSLAWIPREGNCVACGNQDGSISTLVIKQNILGLKGTWAHACPVERLAVENVARGRIASGAHHELFIWSIRRGGKWVREVSLQRPSDSLYSKDHTVIVTSIHWMPAKSTLLATFMYHGIVMFSSQDWTILRAFPLNSTIVDASVRPDLARIVLSNATSGFDIYDLDSGSPEAFLPAGPGACRAVPVLFIHGGNALLSGSTTGQVALWDVDRRRRHHTLLHADDEVVLAIAAHYLEPSDRFLVATGVMGGAARGSVFVWKAEGMARVPPRWTTRFTFFAVSLIGTIICLGVALRYAQSLYIL
ncbi:WD40 repeat-like protein [Trametes cingulata]|nr:WD40 repeat-like protein [Trametes cingulata]